MLQSYVFFSEKYEIQLMTMTEFGGIGTMFRSTKKMGGKDCLR